MPEAISTQQRIVPGAPPPAPLSKTQKKKRKTKTKTGEDGNNIDHIDSPATPVPDATASTLVDKESDATDVQTCSLAPDVVVHPEPETPSIPDELKPSPIVELVNKRLKATTKKIARMTTYAATDPEKLNDDQKRTLKTLPTLEAIQKELGEVKKAVENYEADLAHELLVKKLEAERAERAKIAEAVAASQDLSVKRTADILDLLRLRSHLALGELDALPVDETEGTALLSVADALLGDHEEKRQTVINGFLRGTDGFDGISYARLVDIIKAGLAPPHAPTPPLEEPVDDRSEAAVEVEVETVDTVETIPAVAITGVLAVAPISKGFSFVQESEIEEAPADDIEWVDAGAATQEQAPEEELLADGDVEQEAPLQEYTQEAVQPATEEPATSAPLDWATDDADLPPIASVQESIGASGSATPGDAQPKFAETATGETDGPASAERHNEEVVAQSRGGRGGRGRGLRSGFRSFRGERGGFRGERGGFRGGERSGFHGGERGGFHGGERGGDRGGFRPRGEGRGGERGGFHGGDRGGFHGGENGEFRGGDRGGFRGRGGYRGRGDWRGDGEHRGRGRGRPRGHGGERGGAPAATTPVATEPVA